MRRLIVGDVHGCRQELEELLERAGLSEEDEIIAVGDLVDRGPDSYGVWDLFRRRPGARCLLGNHERKHRRARQGLVQPALSQQIAQIQFPPGEYERFCDWCESLPLFIELEEAILVHGFFEPGVPLEEQREEVLVGTRRAEKYLHKQFGEPWYAHYDGPKPLIVGHRNYGGHKPFVFRDRVFGVDTKCFAGGALTGLLLPEFRWISVPSRQDYWSAARTFCRPLRPLLQPDGAVDPATVRELLAWAERCPERDSVPEPLRTDLDRFLNRWRRATSENVSPEDSR